MTGLTGTTCELLACEVPLAPGGLAAEERVRPGTWLGGRYLLGEELAHGGMSTVHRAYDGLLERTVAIKLISGGHAGQPAAAERFRREARAMARVVHPNVVAVLDAGELAAPADDSAATPYIVLEHIHGGTLKQRIRQAAPLEPAEAFGHAIAIASGLGAAHRRGIVHRDVKPQNVLVGRDGEVKLIDFGIARSLTEEGLTLDGRIVASADYMAPEQALGEPASAQSDLYSLGVVLYEMLTGVVPLTASSAVAVAMRHVREELPDVGGVRLGLPEGTAAVLARATARDARRRHGDAESLIADLRALRARA